MFWLGSASLVSRVIDALAMIIVLGFLTREELGLATLAWSVTTLLETLNGLGINTALIQRPQLDDDDSASAHWYAVLTAIVLIGLVALGAPLLARFYDAPTLAPLIWVSSSKLLFVGLANVPLALLSRRLDFRTLGAVTSGATLLSAVLTIALAAAGAGAWAPLLGNTAHGLFQWLGTLVVAPFWPRLVLSPARLRPMIKPGLSVAGAGTVGQLTKNLDYFVVGQLGGFGTLGSYRVAFELAMAPTLAILQVINRSALPVFSRLASDVSALRDAFAWTARSALLLVLAPLLLVFFEGSTIVVLLGKQPEPYLETVLQCLCGAALLRTIAQAYPQVFVAKGYPHRSLIEAVATVCLLSLSLVLCLVGLESWPVMVRVALAWLLAYVALQPVDVWLARDLIPGNVRALFASLKAPLLLALLLGALLEVALPFSPLEAPGLRMLVHGGLIVALYVLGLRTVVGVKARGLLARRAPGSKAPDGQPARGEPVA